MRNDAANSIAFLDPLERAREHWQQHTRNHPIHGRHFDTPR
jgi:hypothetical protein